MRTFFRFIGWWYAVPWAVFGPVMVVYGVVEGEYGAAAGMAGMTIFIVAALTLAPMQAWTECAWVWWREAPSGRHSCLPSTIDPRGPKGGGR